VKKALFTIIALILALGLALPMGTPAAAVSTIPHLEVDKSVSSPYVVVGEPVTVTLTLTGAGVPIGERRPLDVILIIDRSGSMAWDDPTRLSQAKDAAKDFIDYLASHPPAAPDYDRVGLVSFTNSATLNKELTDDFASVKVAIDTLYASAATNIGAAIHTANGEFDANDRTDALQAEILLTDGLPNKPSGPGDGFWEPDAAYARTEAQAAHDADIILYTIGLGEDISHYFLDDYPASGHDYNSGDPAEPYDYDGLAYIGGGEFYYAPDGDDLQAIFVALAGELITIAGQNVVLTEVLPDGVNYVPGSIVPPPDSIDGQTLIWNLGTINIGETVTATFDVTFDEPGYQQVDDPATNVAYDDYLGDPQTKPFTDPYITVNPPDNTAPVAMDNTVATDEDTTYTFSSGDFTFTDVESDSLTKVEITTLPDKGVLKLSGVDVTALDQIAVGDIANLTYDPVADENGTPYTTFTFKVEAGAGSWSAAVATMTINVNAVNDAPVADDQSVTTNEDTAKAITLTATDADGDPLTYSIVAPPSNGDLTGLPPDVTYTPDADYNGPDSFTFKANDGTYDSNTATVSITVDPVNDAPVANDDSATVAEGGTVTVVNGTDNSVLDNDTDAEGDTLTAILVNDVTNGMLTLNSDGTFSYTHDGSETTSDSFTYKANDGEYDSNIATVSITITGVNDAPVANDDTATVAEGGTVTVLDTAATSVLDNDTDAEGDTLTAILVNDVTNGMLTLNSDGTFNYTHDGSETTSDSFTYKANDGEYDSNTATVSITVDPVNDAPVADDQSVTTAEDTPKVITLSGSDVETVELTFSIENQPGHGSLGSITDNSGTSGTPNTDTASVTYTPDANYNGSDSFTFKVNDGTDNSNTATVSITVSAMRRGGGGGSSAGTLYFTVDFQGKITKEPMSSAGRLLNPLEAPSPDGMHLLEMAKGTKTVDDQGKIVKLIEIREAEAPSLTANTVIVGNAYDFQPSDITFSQPIRLTLGYDNLPEDVASIALAYYTATTGWTELKPEGGVVAGEGKLTAPVDHFTIFAILAELTPPPPPPSSPPPAPAAFEVDNLQITPSQSRTWEPVTFVVKTGEEVTISAYVTNYGGQEGKYTAILKVNGVTQATKEIILGSGQDQQISFTLAENEPGLYTVEIGGLSGEFVTSVWANWWLMGGILAGLILIGWLAWYYGYYRRRQ